MKTIKQIADEIGIGKQRVYRYIKNHHISEAHHDVGVMCFDEAVEMSVKSHFLRNAVSGEAHHEAHQSVSSDTVFDTVISMLKQELEAKNKLIDEQQQIIKDLNITIRIQAESINAANKNELAETIIDGNKKLIGETQVKERGGIFKIFSRKK